MAVAYRVSVELFSVFTQATKSIWRVRVIGISKNTITIDDYGSKLRVDKKDIFDSEEAAEAECSKRAEALKAKLKASLEERLKELDSPAHKSQRFSID